MKQTYKIVIAFLVLAALISGCSCGKKSPSLSKEEMNTSDSIKNVYQSLKESEIKQSELNLLMKNKDTGDIYYLASNGKRYIFPTIGTYKSWFRDYDPKIINALSLESLYQTPLGGNVFYKPYSLIQTETDPNIYFVDRGGQLRVVSNLAILPLVYGDDWRKLVENVPNNIFTSYTLGPQIDNLAYFPVIEGNLTISLNQL